jgi:hypothetical protein
MVRAIGRWSSGIVPQKAGRETAELHGRDVELGRPVAVFQHRRRTPPINWFKRLIYFTNSLPKRGPDRHRFGTPSRYTFQRLIKEIERNQVGSGFDAGSHRETLSARWDRGSDSAFLQRGSTRLAKFQHVDIDRLGRGMRGGVSGIPGDVEEIAVVDQFESRRLDLRSR